MDSIRKKINHLDQPIFKLLLRLFTATFFYFFIIKKFLVFLFKEYILDYFVFISNTMEINIILVGDDIKIKSSVDHIESFYMSLPFNAFYFFFVFLTLPKTFRTRYLFVHLYNLALFIINPLLLILVLNGYSISDNIIRVHEIVYKILFLGLGMYIFSKDHK
tara:strand:+ start:1397 stop:1882 length:486 start_codon:yes stop_codon:yes gene_type:complete